MAMNLFQELAAGKRSQYRLEKRYLRKDGRMVWAHLTVSWFGTSMAISLSLIREREG